jgi:hypothetical protein
MRRVLARKRRLGTPANLECAYRSAIRRAARMHQAKLDARLRGNLRKRFKEVMAGKGSSSRLLGISLAGFRQHLESLFQPGMTWANYGPRGWHIDHKRPLASFLLPAQQAEAFHYTNLQPLWWRDNLAKGAKIAL